jgi:hypothetical protein
MNRFLLGAGSTSVRWAAVMAEGVFSPAVRLRHRLVVLVLFGITFGYVEAAAVAYIRATYEPVHRRLFPDAPDDLFPLFTLEQWAQEGPPTVGPLLEVGRELGTVVMVALLAWGVSRTLRDWFASFALAFGVWDVFYYLWLKVLIGWPRSLSDWDLVFAAPLPWVGPVAAPLTVAGVLIATAAVFFWREAQGRPLRPRLWHWVAVLAGALLILVAFWWDARSVLANGVPDWFNWPLLLLGLAVGLVGFVHSLLTSPPDQPTGS